MASLKDFSHFDLLFPSKYLKAGDLRGKEVTVVIDDIDPRHELMGAGGRKDTKPLLYLRTPSGRKLDKGLVMNKTNGRRILALYGPELTEWIGKPITLRAEKEPKSDSGEAIRVKEERPRLRANGNGNPPKPEPEEPRHDEATGEVLEQQEAFDNDEMPAWDTQ
jgi:hypothetical protein